MLIWLFVPLCWCRFPSGKLFHLLEGLHVTFLTVSGWLAMPSFSFCVSESLYFMFVFEKYCIWVFLCARFIFSSTGFLFHIVSDKKSAVILFFVPLSIIGLFSGADFKFLFYHWFYFLIIDLKAIKFNTPGYHFLHGSWCGNLLNMADLWFLANLETF